MIMTDSTIQSRLQSLRQMMKKSFVDVVIIHTADPHLSEYLPEYWQSRSWL